MKFVLCPELVEAAANDKDIYLHILMEVIQNNNPHRLYLDKHSVLLDEYKAKAQSDPNGVIDVWLSLVSDIVGLQATKLVDIPLVSTVQEAVIKVASTVFESRNIATYDPSYYEPYRHAIESFKIAVLDPYETKSSLFSQQSVQSFYELGGDLVQKAIRMTERKYFSKIEDLHNDDVVHFLRDKGYCVGDQSRSGRSEAGKSPGELDAAVRDARSGVPVSIVEAFRLESCGKDNTVISRHINKLLHFYDTSGLPTNFVLVYAEAADFTTLWSNYKQYISDLNSKPEYSGNTKLVSFMDTGTDVSPVANVRVGRAIHSHGDRNVEVIHIVLNMHVGGA